MSLLHKNESLLRLGADDWLIPDIQSAYEATDFAYDLGDKVAIDSIWTVGGVCESTLQIQRMSTRRYLTGRQHYDSQT